MPSDSTRPPGLDPVLLVNFIGPLGFTIAIPFMVYGVEDQGAVQGIADSAGSLANIIGLLLGGIAYESVGPKTFLLSAGCALVAFVLSLRLLHR